MDLRIIKIFDYCKNIDGIYGKINRYSEDIDFNYKYVIFEWIWKYVSINRLKNYIYLF